MKPINLEKPEERIKCPDQDAWKHVAISRSELGYLD
jgi:hypothetical protein